MIISRKQKGFTLIELITVIAIILILMGLLFPALNSIKESAKKVQAKNDIAGIVTAVKAFYTEYGKYPVPAAATPPASDVTYGIGSNSNNQGTYKSYQLFNILRNTTTIGNNPVKNADEVTAQNPRGIVFMEGNTAKNSKNGFDSDGNFLDPWGRPYAVAVDTSYDNVTLVDPTISQYTDLANSYTTESQSGNQGVPGGVVVISFGKDGKQGTNGDKKYNGSDDVISWQ
jgi:prepilin-type N-terminal cleavage/methylation domain-containing protein